MHQFAYSGSSDHRRQELDGDDRVTKPEIVFFKKAFEICEASLLTAAAAAASALAVFAVETGDRAPFVQVLDNLVLGLTESHFCCTNPRSRRLSHVATEVCVVAVARKHGICGLGDATFSTDQFAQSLVEADNVPP